MFYDVFSSDYDKFVNWNGRLSAEIPFVEKLLNAHGARKVLDSACGTGMHAIRLAKDGFLAFGCDLSPKMVEVSATNARKESKSVEFFEAGFGELAKKSPEKKFDAILCLGNSLPHVTDLSHLDLTLIDMYEHLPEGGLLIIQNRNFDAVIQDKQRWMEPQAANDELGEILFHRFYDFLADGSIDFNVMITKRPHGGKWSQQVITTHLIPITSSQITQALRKTGFNSVDLFGDLTGNVFERSKSPNIVAIATK